MSFSFFSLSFTDFCCLSKSAICFLRVSSSWFFNLSSFYSWLKDDSRTSFSLRMYITYCSKLTTSKSFFFILSYSPLHFYSQTLHFSYPDLHFSSVALHLSYSSMIFALSAVISFVLSIYFSFSSNIWLFSSRFLILFIIIIALFLLSGDMCSFWFMSSYFICFLPFATSNISL